MKKWIFGSLILLVVSIFLTFYKAPVKIQLPAANKVFQDEIKSLVDERKYQQALDKAEVYLKKMQESKNDFEYARALIEKFKLQLGLNQQETAVIEFKQAVWPEDKFANALVELYYAYTLINYFQRYSWEINQREQVVTTKKIDIKKWTTFQISSEINKAFSSVFQKREMLQQLRTSEATEFFELNNYPANIRPTLRDAFSYLWTQHLNRSTFWTPQESNEVYKLNLEMLLNKRPDIDEGKLASSQLHPLTKIAYILQDLEEFHKKNDEDEAGIEARLERGRIFNYHFTSDRSKKVLLRFFKNTVDKAPDLPWKSMAYADLASFAKGLLTPDALIEAKSYAEKGLKAFPSSVGGKYCKFIIESIVAPQFEVEGMSIDATNKPSIQLTYKNLGKIYFFAYKMDFLERVNSKTRYEIIPQYKELEYLVNLDPVHSWSVDLEQTKDYKMHKKFIVPDLKEKGFYVVLASAREDYRQKSNNNMRATKILISDLVLQKSKQDEVTWLYKVKNAVNGKQISGFNIEIYQASSDVKYQLVKSIKTNDAGEFKYQTPRHGQANFLVVAKGNGDFSFDINNEYYGRDLDNEKLENKLFIYTDRSIYRPGQKINFKILNYFYDINDTHRRQKGNVIGKDLVVELRDANNELIESVVGKTNAFATFSGAFVIPANRALGSWHIKTKEKNHRKKRQEIISVQVEEYKRPTFEANLLQPEQPIKLNEKARIKGDAKYYFGLPVTEGNVSWTVRRQARWPWWWNWCFWGGGSFSFDRDQFIASGTSKLNESGEYFVDFIPEADASSAQTGVTYNYFINVDVTNAGGETRTTSKSFQAGFVAVKADISQKQNLFIANKKNEILISKKSLNEQPLAGEGKWKLYTIIQPTETRPLSEELQFLAPQIKTQENYFLVDDKKKTRWTGFVDWSVTALTWQKGEEVKAGEVDHDKSGLATVELAGLRSGFYRLEYETFDSFQQKYVTTKDIFIAGEKNNLNYPLIVVPEKNEYQPGEKFNLFVHSGFKDQQIDYIIKHGRDIIKKGILFSTEKMNFISIPIEEKYRGGIQFLVNTVYDHQDSEVIGHVDVPWTDKELEISFVNFRDKLRPLSKASFSVDIKHKNNKLPLRGAAEVLAYMYDRSLDAFRGHNPASPLSYYPTYSSFYNPTRTNLSISYGANYYHLYRWLPISQPENLNPDQVKFFTSYGIGGLGARFEEAATNLSGGMSYAPKRRKTKSTAMSPSIENKMQSDQGAATEKTEKNVLRSNFNETAFWQPHLRAKSGKVNVSFKTPDSVTDWNVWVLAIAKSFKFGSAIKTAKTVKDLMVRPYLPRFFRENDQGNIKIMVDNTSDKKMKVEVTTEIFDPKTQKNLMKEFGFNDSIWKTTVDVAANQSNSVVIPVKVPSKITEVAFKVIGKSGNWQDGEQRPLPILPSRMHLAQSRFVTLEKNKTQSVEFKDLQNNDDKTLINEKVVVTLDAQLFYSLLSSLPYLVKNPYESIDSILNRFVTTSILNQIFKSTPQIAKFAAQFSKDRSTPLEKWDRDDPNRKLFLEESPWLSFAKGGTALEKEILTILNPAVVKAQMSASLAKLQKLQKAEGGFPWFSGGQSSPYITLLVVGGFAKCVEFGVEVPKDIVVKSWNFLHKAYKKEKIKNHNLWLLIYTNYLASSFKDSTWTGNYFTLDERNKILDFTFDKWKEISPYLKAYLSLTLHRMGQEEKAKLVFDSIMDSAKTTDELGTYWAPEDRSWLWYRDDIESHAYVLRAMTELSPKDERREGLVKWLFLNKKLNHWKSSRATAEVMYSLIHYLKAENLLGKKEHIQVKVGQQQKDFSFSPDTYQGKSRHWVIEGKDVKPQMANISFKKTDTALGFASATWHFSTEKLPKESSGDFLSVTRNYFLRKSQGKEKILQPLTKDTRLSVGDEVEVQLSLTSKHDMEYIHLRDPRVAGFEPGVVTSGWKWDLGLARYEEVRDSGTNFFIEYLPVGEYTLKYRLKATMAGQFRVGPATLQSLYAPEFNAYSSGEKINIQDQ